MGTNKGQLGESAERRAEGHQHQSHRPRGKLEQHEKPTSHNSSQEIRPFQEKET